jgi:hypothetical protein
VDKKDTLKMEIKNLKEENKLWKYNKR